MHSDNRMMQGFFLRSKEYDSAEGLSKLKWQNISSCYDSANAFVCGTRKNGIAYWSPDVAGFSGSVGYFEDDEWGAALRYKDGRPRSALYRRQFSDRGAARDGIALGAMP